MEISNPRAVLEHALRNYSCVTIHDIIQIPYNSKNYQFELKDVKPAPAACIIETDCNVDFDAPVGYVEPEQRSSTRSSACPSPATTASTATAAAAAPPEEEKPAAASSGIRIVDGKIIRPDETMQSNSVSDMLAEKTGSTGVQQNSAVLQPAPEIDYWAVAAGDGARLDGKKPAVLQDASGSVVDVRQLRAEAAARRAQAEAAASASLSLQSKNGMTVSGEQVEASTEAAAAAAVPVSKRKKRVGSKYSKLKSSSSAFQGSANQFHSNK